MHEKILVTFKRNGRVVPVTGIDPDFQDGGIILSGESSALPRGYGISLLPIDPGTKSQVSRLAVESRRSAPAVA